MTKQIALLDHSFWTDEQKEAALRVKQTVKEHDLQLIRIAWADQHGISRAKTITAGNFDSILENGMDFNTGPLFFDTANTGVFNPFEWGGGVGLDEMTGCPNYCLIPDPLTFRILPWTQNTGWILCDAYLKNGKPLMFDTRQVCKQALRDLRSIGYDMKVGLEVEWVLTKIEDSNLRMDNLGAPGSPTIPPVVTPVSRGYQYQLESHNDEIDDILQVLVSHIQKLGLPLRTIEDEFGPSQIEFTFAPMDGIQAADAMVLLRTAIKQICRRNGYIATFMCRPAFAGMAANGWHMHQSLVDIHTGQNGFVSNSDDEPLSETGKHFIGGILRHARASAVFTTPTVNGYKRFKENSLAPDRAGWGTDNRGTMIRVMEDRKNARFENRAGEPAANPYLYLASQIYAGLDGILNKINPGLPSAEGYNDNRDPLPKSLEEAIGVLKEDSFFKEKMGTIFIDYLVKLKESEINRYKQFLKENNIQDDRYIVTEWEHREYFEIY
ncbi:glutamine synthetase family protein [Neobacillus kokaensis]|uniref:glutamine synthetase n=1 Tax=Neobacillus kokaensis TaxID=2759023 RepID=A0ABQ3NA36_9BACI|nr:glutamine synthetase family protein [Neobacillus kokaensis]GHH99805.1 glutamine synthetase [Neobacillus kokaensis]